MHLIHPGQDCSNTYHETSIMHTVLCLTKQQRNDEAPLRLLISAFNNFNKLHVV